VPGSSPSLTTNQRFERARFPAALSNGANPSAIRPRPRAARNSKRVSASKSANAMVAISKVTIRLIAEIGYHLAIEMIEFLEKPDVLKQLRTARTSRESILSVGDWAAGDSCESLIHVALPRIVVGGRTDCLFRTGIRPACRPKRDCTMV
jgi:hypothetical protein